jgi:hypothetical protein
MLVFNCLKGHMGSMAIEDEQMLIFERNTTWYWPLKEKKEFFENKYSHPCFLLHSHIGPWFANTMRKRGVLQFDICNSLYLYAMNSNGQVAWVTKLQLTVYMVQLIATQLQLNQNNSFSTTIQLHYNYTHGVMLTSLIVIHL